MIEYVILLRGIYSNRFVSFQSPANDGSGRSQEYYQLHSIKNYGQSLIGRMKYRRFGECPSWYSVGKSSSVELQGECYRSLKRVPKETWNLFTTSFGDDLSVSTFLKTLLSSSKKEKRALLKSFSEQEDILDRYKPWYSRK